MNAEELIACFALNVDHKKSGGHLGGWWEQQVFLREPNLKLFLQQDKNSDGQLDAKEYATWWGIRNGDPSGAAADVGGK